jgi:hypothetical protein
MCRALEKSNFAPRELYMRRGWAGCKLNESRKLSAAALERPNLTHFFIPFLRVRQSAFHLPLDLFTCTRSFNFASRSLKNSLSRFSTARSPYGVCDWKRNNKERRNFTYPSQIAAAFFAGGKLFKSRPQPVLISSACVWH